jgi:serine phosphatase RsbU (regulator of sigma subunit)
MITGAVETRLHVSEANGSWGVVDSPLPFTVPGADSEWSKPSEATASLMRTVLLAMPISCSWLYPVRAPGGQITDYLTLAASAGSEDIAGRGADERIGAPLSHRYPGIVGGEIWQLYAAVMDDGTSRTLPEFMYEESASGVAHRSIYSVSVHRVLGGLLVVWQRVDDHRRRMEQMELLGDLGWGEWDLVRGRVEWSPGMYRIFGRDPAQGPLTRAEQAAIVVAEDRMLRETVWQTLADREISDVTLRVRIGEEIRHLRVVSDVDRDADGKEVKIYGVVQDVTAREESRTELEQVTQRLRRQQDSLLAEHRLAAQLQEIILPLPAEPFDLPGLRLLVRYLPAERTNRIGGDWYLATTDASGGSICAIGDVAGHGLEAATAMAQLRYALVAWIATGTTDPGQLTSNLNALCRRLHITATAIVSRFDPVQTTLTWAQAGHVAPLLARAGAAQDLERPYGMLLGALTDATYHTATLPLLTGDLLLFYTDGLIERRAGSTDQRLSRVRAHLAELSATAPGQPLAQLQTMLQFANRDDDTCLLALRRHVPKISAESA